MINIFYVSVPEIGKQSCIESIDEVRRFLENDYLLIEIGIDMLAVYKGLDRQFLNKLTENFKSIK